jgi:hypothetical protein
MPFSLLSYSAHLLCLRNARAFPLSPAALASLSFGFVLVRVRVTQVIRLPTSDSLPAPFTFNLATSPNNFLMTIFGKRSKRYKEKRINMNFSN